jgi:hypothetical protein
MDASRGRQVGRRGRHAVGTGADSGALTNLVSEAKDGVSARSLTFSEETDRVNYLKTVSLFYEN